MVVVPVGSELASAQKGINKEAENEGDGDNCYVPDTASGTEDMAANKTDTNPSLSLRSRETKKMNQ